MSYILEALRKADAERERGSVPDLHAQLLPLSVSDAEVERPRSPLGLWLGLGVGLVAAAGAGWWWLGRDEPAAVAPRIAATAAPPVAAPPVPIAATPPMPPAPEAAVVTPQVQPTSEPEASAPKPVAKPKPKAAASAPGRTAQPPKPNASVPRAEPPAPAVRVPTLAELPGELRQLVPPLVVGGSVYSPQASARMVVINGQVFQEGNSLAPELKLEQVRQKTAVFSIRGQRFEVPL